MGAAELSNLFTGYNGSYILTFAGYNAGRGSFVQSFGSRDLDASLLLMPIVGFLPAADPRVELGEQALAAPLGPPVRGAAAVGRHGRLQGLGVVVGQAAAAQRLTGHPGQVVARGHLGHGVRRPPGPGHLARGQREPDQIGADRREF